MPSRRYWAGSWTRRGDSSTGRSPDLVNLTHPAEWGASRRNILLTAARMAGSGPNVSLIPEPVAAAAHFSSLPGEALRPGSALNVYDVGGGTFDCAVVESTPNGFVVLAESGLADVGGVDFDQAVIDHLGSTVSEQGPARWQALSRPRNSADRRAARTLREDVRAGKETLSRYAQTDLPLPDPFDDTLLTRREFEGLVRPVIARTVEVLAGTIRRSGLGADRLGGIYLVGGSSRIPLVAGMIADKLDVMPTTLDQPETAVAMGAALIPGRPAAPGRTDFVGFGAVWSAVTGPSGAGAPAPPGQNGAGRRTKAMVVASVVVALIAVTTLVIVASRSGFSHGRARRRWSRHRSPGAPRPRHRTSRHRTLRRRTLLHRTLLHRGRRPAAAGRARRPAAPRAVAPRPALLPQVPPPNLHQPLRYQHHRVRPGFLRRRR